MDEEDQQSKPLPSIGSFLGYMPHMNVAYRSIGMFIKKKEY